MIKLFLLKYKRKESEYFNFEVFFTLSALKNRKAYYESRGEYVTSACIVGDLQVDKSCSFLESSIFEDFKTIK